MDLPNGWTATTLRSVADWSSGGTPSRKRADFFGGEIPWVKTGELTKKYVRETEEKLTALGVKNSSAKVFPKGSVGVAMYGATIGKVSIWGIDASTNQACAVARPINNVVSSEFLYHFLRSEEGALVGEGKGGAQPNISQGLLKAWPIALPPLNEQRRIVEKIEAMFDEIDKGVESLRAAKSTLDLYRKSLLKAAFEGRLTADWRARNPDKVESPDNLLGRIRQEREERYQAALKDWREAVSHWVASGENGKKPAKPKKPKVYPSKFAGLRVALPELPQGWTWSHLGWCSMGPEYGTAAKSSDHGDVPVIRMGNLQDGRIDWQNLAYTSNTEEIERYSLKAGDVLFNRTNSPELVGKSAIYRGERPALFAGYLVRVNQIDEIASGPFVAYFLNSSVAREHGNTIKTDGVNQSNINGTKLQHYPFPFCPVAEQLEIVRILDECFETADTLEAEIGAGLARAEALRHSILKRAFAGRLVAQDPQDEPASDLLARIGASRNLGSTTTPQGPAQRRISATHPP